MRQLFRVVAINLAVFVGLFLGLMLTVSIGGDAVTLVKLALQDGDKRGRHEMPPYEDKAHAALVFEEQADTEEDYRAFVGWRRLPYRGRTLTIDEEGLRRHRVGRDNAPDARRLFFFGDSVIWGTGVDDDHTVPAIFDTLSTAYDVTNYAEGAWNSRQSLAQLVNLLNRNQAPDIAIFYGGANDAEIGCNAAFGEAPNSHHETPHLRQMVRDSQTRSYLYRNFWVPARDTFYRVTGRDPVETRRLCAGDPARAETAAEGLVRNWEMAKLLVEAAGGRFYAFLQPVAGVGAPNVGYLELDPDRIAQYGPVYERVREKLARRGQGWAFDLSRAFDGETPILVDHSHAAPHGNEIIARRILDAIER
jgi:lysophospholipase L1-like esterase